MALDLVQQQRLTQHPDQAIRERALALFAKPGDSDRQRIVDEYAAALDLPGDVVRGKAVFERRCAACHRLDGVGNEVGADLGPYAAKPRQALLIALFDPNQAVDPRYHSYVAALTDGRVLTGTIIDETGTSLTLVSPEGKKQPVLRADIDELANTGKSLMPEGFERELSLQDTADLVVWFSRLRSPPKALAGNQPSLAGPAADGSLALTAAKAEIRGQDITFEEHFGNVGYWHGPDDHVRWQVELPRATSLDVWLDWSCAADSAGNLFVIQAGGEELQGTVESTGGWNTYRQARVGSIDLPAGQAEITVRPAGPLNRALFDLRAVFLMPPGQAPQLAEAGAREPKDPASLARYLLNDSHPAGQRAERIDATAGVAAEVLAVMVADLTPGPNERSRKEEYRRIPWIWRVSIAAGRRNDPRELCALLNVALPKPGEPMHDWQAVVIGGGLINGISLSGAWPRAELEKLLNQEREPVSASAPKSGSEPSSGDPLLSRWRRSIELAVAMADNEPTPTGTRYDALRMLAMQDWDDCHEQLTRYLAKGIHDELQMGAISGLSDIPSPEVAAVILSGIAHYSDSNRNLVFDALLRTPDRARALLAALSSGVVTVEQLGPDRLQALRVKAEE
ncbi:MAG: c-type cytochrome [Pirellulales bacterium]